MEQTQQTEAKFIKKEQKAKTKLKLSLNKHLLNKTQPHGARYLAEGFEPVEITIQELATAVSEGVAYSSQFTDSYRKSHNFLASDVLSLDFDGGVTIDEIVQNALVKEHASLLYTTVSHTDDAHRFRLVFVLPRTIECPNEMKWATKALEKRLGSDPSATDAARWFAGSHGCEFQLLGGGITPVLLDELIEDGRKPIRVKQHLSVPAIQSRSGRPVQENQAIQLASGETMAFAQIEGKTSVYCPFHMDHTPSAFVAETRSGKFLRCSSCEQTWWGVGTDSSTHDFHNFDKAVRDLKASPRLKLPIDLVGLEKYMAPFKVSPQNIWLQNKRHLRAPQFMYHGVNDGLFFIKSPKGTGKTYFLSELLNKRTSTVPAQLPDVSDDPKIVPFKSQPNDGPEIGPTDPKVLVIGHRKALIGELCQRLGLRSYLDLKKSRGFYADQARMQRLGVCLDSLEMVKGQKYDVIVIDEIEQVLKHFLGGTIGFKRQRIFDCFAELIASAKQVIALDADLGWLSFVALNNLKNASPLVAEASACPVHILLNDHHIPGRSIEAFGKKDHLVGDMKKAVLEGKRLFIASNSKALVDGLNAALQELSDKNAIEIRSILITSDNSTTAAGQEFIKNIKERILDYQVVLCSPSLGTGIDITFPDDEQKIDCVYGFFENGITSHFDIDQQLCRVRHPKATKVWISKRCFNFETHFEIVQGDILNADLFGAVDYGNMLHGLPRHDTSVSFLTMATLAAIKDRASTNRLRTNFFAAKHAAGWEVIQRGDDDCVAKIGTTFREHGCELAEKKYRDRVMSARTLKESEFERLRRRMHVENGELTLDEKFSFWRTSLEKFYRAPVSLGLIEFDAKGMKRGVIRLYEALKEAAHNPSRSDDIVLPYDRKLFKRTHLSVLPDLNARTLLLHELLQTTPVYQDGRFLDGVEFCHGDLSEFAKAATRWKPYIEGQLGISVRSDVLKKPMQFLGMLLSLIGLSAKVCRQPKEGDANRIRYYAILADTHDLLEDICKRRTDLDGWKFVRGHYGFEDTLEDMEFLAGWAA